jgi:hypothetical protein
VVIVIEMIGLTDEEKELQRGIETGAQKYGQVDQKVSIILQ